MQLVRTKRVKSIEMIKKSERKEKENLSLSIALWRRCFYLCILKFPNNQLQMKKKHLTKGQRYEISAYLQSGKTQKEILSRKIWCNADSRNGLYKPELAQRKYQSRMNKRVHFKRLNESLKLQVEISLKADLRPEQVAGYLKRNNCDCVSHEIIYL